MPEVFGYLRSKVVPATIVQGSIQGYVAIGWRRTMVGDQADQRPLICYLQNTPQSLVYGLVDPGDLFNVVRPVIDRIRPREDHEHHIHRPGLPEPGHQFTLLLGQPNPM
jgi:hypothetical protein